MTRAEVKDLLISCGVAEPTEEQISNMLNKHNADVQREKDLANKYKDDALKVKDLEEQLEKLNNQNLSEIDIANKNAEKANARIAELEKQIKATETRKSLAEKGIVGEQADKFFNEDGSINFDNLGSILEATRQSAISQREKELLAGTPNPTGSNNNGNIKTDIDNLAEKVGKDLATMNQSATDVLSHYI